MSAPKKSRVNVAVVGLGFMGVTHLRSYLNHPQARVVAVCAPTRLPVKGVLRGVAGNIQQPGDLRLGPRVKAYRDYAELLADRDVDLVDLCTPTAGHPAQAVAALQAGKHVLCEKPLAANVAGARQVLKAAAAASTFLMPAMCMRFWPGWAGLKQIVADRIYGGVRAANFRRHSAPPAWGQAGTHAGGALLDLHIHDTDFVNYLFGRPRRVFATGIVGAGDVINHVMTQYDFGDGPAVSAEGSWLRVSGFNMGFTLLCERATLDYDLARGTAALRVTEAGKKTRTVRLPAGDGYHAEIRYFVDCVLRGQKPEIVTARDAVTALEVCAAEEQSVRTGQPVNI